MNILWEPGDGFVVAVKATENLQPRTLITYFPALPFWERQRLPRRTFAA